MFSHAVMYSHLYIASRLIELTPKVEKLDYMLNYNSSFVFQTSAQEGNLKMSQYLLSLKPELKSLVLSKAKNEIFKQKIADSDKFIQKLIEVRKKGESEIIKIFDYLEYGKVIINLLLTGKSFIAHLQTYGILDIIMDYLVASEIKLTQDEKVKILKAMSNSDFLSNDVICEQNKNITLLKENNIQDKKVSFVEKINAQTDINNKLFIRRCGYSLG